MKEKLNLSPQACGAIMMALQKSFQNVMAGKPPEECDVSLMLRNFQLSNSPTGLVVDNPVTLDYTVDSEEEDSEEN